MGKGNVSIGRGHKRAQYNWRSNYLIKEWIF
jgi:hypothetical protein